MEDVSSKLDERAALFKDRAEALLLEPMRSRIVELDMQAKMGVATSSGTWSLKVWTRRKSLLHGLRSLRTGMASIELIAFMA